MTSETADTARSLGDSINIATRSIHAKLNKLILARLPLAIPPQAKDPSKYVFGLLHVTPIYSTFESAWRVILELPGAEVHDHVVGTHSCEACKPSSAVHHMSNTLDTPHQPVVCTRLQSLLGHLYTTDLDRTDCLKQDIVSMTGWSTDLLEEKLAGTAESPFLSTFLGHIRQSVHDRPHVLLAYAWVLYMALFSGGRFIKGTLARVDMEFWAANLMTTGSRKETEVLPLHFFTFDAPDDGEEIKLAFKKRLSESESLLTQEEFEDVVAEAKRIFEYVVEVVGELDGVCGKEAEVGEGQDQSIMWRMSRLLGLRARDSE